MAYAMTKQGSLTNFITYEFICDTVADMNAIETEYRTLGSVAIVLAGESGMEVYMAGSDKEWNSLTSLGGNAAPPGLTIYICGQNEVSNGLPDVEEPDDTTLYLIPAQNETNNLYEEYVWVNDAWERFGGATLDLSGYATLQDIAGFYTKPAGGIPGTDLANNYALKNHTQLTGSLSLGRKANSTVGDGSVAVGDYVEASGLNSHAEGHSTIASGLYSHAEGFGATSSGQCSHTEGYNTVASGTKSHAEGEYTRAFGDSSHAEGQGYTSSSKIINGVTYTSTGAHGAHAHSEGKETWAIGESSHAEGDSTCAQGLNSHTEGKGTTALGNYSHAEGIGYENSTKTVGNITYTSSGAHGYASHSEGTSTWAIGQASHAEGNNTVASGFNSHAEGNSTTSSSDYSHAEGSNTVASSYGSHAEGSSSQATSYSSHAEGYDTVASGYCSHTEGSDTTASSSYGHAEGDSTTASGYTSHSEGSHTIASGSYSHVQGRYTIASGQSSHVFGEYNIEDPELNWPVWTANTFYEVGDKVNRVQNSYNNYYICTTANNDATFNQQNWKAISRRHFIEIAGNGEGSNTRSNARTLDWEGNERLKGNLYINCNADSTGGNKVVSELDPVFINSISMGRTANSTVGANSTALGDGVVASGSYAHAEGYSTTASGARAHSEGNTTTANGQNSHAEGDHTMAQGPNSHAEGYGGTYTYNNAQYTSHANGTADHTEGYQCLTESNMPGNHAEGYQTRATGGGAHAEGQQTLASGFVSHAEGGNTIASGLYSHAEGQGTTASAQHSHAEGQNTTASGPYSHAEGAYTVASGTYAHAEGFRAQAPGVSSHAEGFDTIATAAGSHVGGWYNVEDSYDTWLEWTANTTYAIGDKVKVTTVSNNTTTVTGYVCKIAHTSATTFSRTYWTSDVKQNYVEIIGNGTENERSNARALTWTGDEKLAGDVYVHCNNDSTGGTKLATETFVNTAVGAIDLSPYATVAALNALTQRVAELESEITSLRNALNLLNVPENVVTGADGTPVTDEALNYVEFDEPTT